MRRGWEAGRGIARFPTKEIIWLNHMRRAPGSTMTPAPFKAQFRQMTKSPLA